MPPHIESWQGTAGGGGGRVRHSVLSINNAHQGHNQTDRRSRVLTCTVVATVVSVGGPKTLL